MLKSKHINYAKNKFSAFLLALAMVIGLLPGMSLTAIAGAPEPTTAPIHNFKSDNNIYKIPNISSDYIAKIKEIDALVWVSGDSVWGQTLVFIGSNNNNNVCSVKKCGFSDSSKGIHKYEWTDEKSSQSEATTYSLTEAQIQLGSLGSDGSVVVAQLLAYKVTFSDDNTVVESGDWKYPVCVYPKDLTATYGQTLANVTITNPAGNTAGTWQWVNENQSVGDAGTHTFKASFTPNDSNNYYTVSNVDLTVTVSKAPAPTVDDNTTNGSSGGSSGQSTTGYEAVDTNTGGSTQTTTTNVTVKGNLSGQNIVEVIQEIETKTEVKTLDLSNVTGVTEVKLPENTKIETLTITENTSIKKVEVSNNDSLKSINLSNSKIQEVNASECSGLETVEVENNEALVTLNVSYSSVTTLNAKNCINLANLKCERCEITELNLEGCEKLSDLNCSYNSLTRLDVSSFTNLTNLVCQGQTVRGVKRVRSFNLIDFFFQKISELFLADYSEEELKELEKVQNLQAFDEYGNEIQVSSDGQGNLTFSKAPATITYDYATGFNNNVMDVTVETAEDESGEDGDSVNVANGSGGSCSLISNCLSLVLMSAFIFKKRRFN